MDTCRCKQNLAGKFSRETAVADAMRQRWQYTWMYIWNESATNNLQVQETTKTNIAHVIMKAYLLVEDAVYFSLCGVSMPGQWSIFHLNESFVLNMKASIKWKKFLNSLHCVISKVSGKHLGQTQSRYNLLYNHTGCICLDFIHCICSSVSSKRFHKKIFSHTEFISVHWVFKWFLNLSTRDDA